MQTAATRNVARRFMPCGSAWLALVLIVPAWLLSLAPAEAVPAFARKYDVSCNVCHTRQPRLNWFGQRFLENGYQLPGTEDGGVTEKSLFGGPRDGATLDDVANYLAVRLRADAQDASLRELTEATEDPEIVFPNISNLFFAGTATKNVSFFLEGKKWFPGARLQHHGHSGGGV